MVMENQDISRRIKARRILKGFTQEDVAKKLDVSLPTYLKMENHPISLNLVKIQKLAIALECEVKNFLFD